MKITNDIRYIGVNDRRIDLFEGQYRVPNGMSYNSYVILDEKIAVMDTVDVSFTHEWLDNLQSVLGGRAPDADEKRKLIAFLSRRGFKFDEIRSAMAEMQFNTEDMSDG